jgi:hypothetical protein
VLAAVLGLVVLFLRTHEAQLMEEYRKVGGLCRLPPPPALWMGHQQGWLEHGRRSSASLPGRSHPHAVQLDCA